MRLLAALLITFALLVPQSAPAAASAMPEAPNCPIYPERGVYRLSLRPAIDGTVWLEDQGVFWVIDVR